jgi:hypothetical protein
MKCIFLENGSDDFLETLTIYRRDHVLSAAVERNGCS